MSQTLAVLGGITAEQFLTEYWQKKPLLVRNALPEIKNLLEPTDVMELALDENINARLIKQKDKDPNHWSVKSSPLMKADFQKMPKLWTLLIQAVDHYSFDLAELWKKFPFIPQWRRDDIMVSYAPKGGSVGKHFDFYDVFLVQGHGHRRWQLGQMCDADSEIVAGQPLKLLPEIQIHFDEILAPGDLLYVPPGLAHYGVAEDDCLTYSFGFRMPNVAEMMDRVSKSIDIMREKGVLVVIVYSGGPAEARKATGEFRPSRTHRADGVRRCLIEGTPGAEIDERIHIDRQRDILWHKHAPSAFFQNDLAERLRAFGVENVLV